MNINEQTEKPNFRLPKTFSSLRHPSFRLFWVGQVISLCGTWMQVVAQSWLVFRLTNSPFLLSAVAAAGNFPILFFSMFGGVAADRFSKRKLIILAQTVAALLAVILGLLVSYNMVKVWYIVVLAVSLGIVEAFDVPARQAFVVEMVGREDLPNAIALNSFIFHASRVVGPALAGLLIGIFDLSLSFFINALSFLPIIIALMLIKLPARESRNRATSIKDELKTGLKFVLGQKEVLVQICFVAIIALFAMPYMALMPAFSKALGLQAKGYGGLMSVVGVGALCGALFLATLQDESRKKNMVPIACALASINLIIFAYSKSLIVASAALFFVGFCFVTGLASSNILIQLLTPHELRGRVMSIYTIMFMGLIPVGNLIIGALTEAAGISGSLGIGGGICILASVLLFQREINL